MTITPRVQFINSTTFTIVNDPSKKRYSCTQNKRGFWDSVLHYTLGLLFQRFRSEQIFLALPKAGQVRVYMNHADAAKIQRVWDSLQAPFVPKNPLQQEVRIIVSDFLMTYLITNGDLKNSHLQQTWEKLIHQATNAQLVDFINAITDQFHQPKQPRPPVITPTSEWFLNNGKETPLAKMFRDVRGCPVSHFFDLQQKNIKKP